MRSILIFLLLASSAFAFDWQSEVQSGDFTDESHPLSTTNINKNGNGVNFIQNGNWIKFAGFNFGSTSSVTNFRIQASKGTSTNSTLRLRLDSPTGPEIGSIEITQTGGWGDFQRFNLFFTQQITGTRDLYLVCEGGGGYLFDLGAFRFQSVGYQRDGDVASVDYSAESHPNDVTQIQKVGKQIQNIKDGNWVSYKTFDFADGAQYLWMEAATPNSGGTIHIRAGSPTGTILGTININSTGSWSSFKPFGCNLSAPLVGIQDLYFTFSGGAGDLFNLAKFRFHRIAPDYKSPNTIAAWPERDPSLWTPAGTFTSESHAGNDSIVRSENGQVTYIQSNSWVGYANYDLGAGVNSISVDASSLGNGGTLEVRLGSSTGSLLGSLTIPGTGGWGNYQTISIDFSSRVSGVQNVFFRFTGSGGYIFNVARFRFQDLLPEAKSLGRPVAANLFDQESNPGAAPVVVGSTGITELTGGSWVSYNNFNFSTGANLITVLAATPNRGGGIEVRTGSSSGPLIARLDVTHTGSWTLFREYTATLLQPVSGMQNLYLGFVDTNGQSGSLFNLQNFVVEKKAAPPAPPTNQGILKVYDPVTGLDPSPYYTYSVQKVSDLNAPLKQNATNWLSPFAWFTECKTGSDPFSTAYYSQEIAGWSHTYCNFELGKNTPIVVKITRTPNSFGAPSGSIFMANVHPVHKVQSCEIINGEVYVTMKEPALVTVDIDGQMDARDAPRISPAELASSKPFASRAKGSHAVSIFANPVINDAPVIGAPGVRFIAAGDPLPAYNDPSWTTLYFGKGVHYFSRNPDGSPGIWTNGDGYVLMSNKTCYIPGDALIYGTFDGRAEPSRKDKVRVYGYGTISGARIPHYQDPYWQLPAQAGTILHERPITLSSGYDCSFEGITLADPANHGISFDFGGGNLRKWIKQVSWRANSDMGGIPGIVEDCFFRLQDDGPYVAGDDFRRNTLWFDCNGSPFRGTFIRRGTYGSGHHAVVEDCDIIYVRSNWGGSVISAGDYWEIGTYPDGTKNTAQHVIFRNIRVTDPRPTRTLFGLERGMAGMRFENIEYRHPHSWGYQSNFSGTATEPMSHCYFDGVFVEGRKMDAPLVADPTLFQTSNISDFVYRDAPNLTPVPVDPIVENVSLLGSWVQGATNAKPSGSSRTLVVMVYGEGNGDISASSVTYGGQAMTKVVDRSHFNSAYSYTAAFVLKEAGVAAASSESIVVNWSSAPSTGSEITSAFFANVNQSSPTGNFASNGLFGDSITTSALANNAGDLVVVGGTAASNGIYTINNGFTRGIAETSASFGDITSAYKLATGADETPSLTMSTSMRQTIVGFVLKRSNGPFNDWAGAWGLTGSNAVATADADFDGIANLVEFTLGLSPIAGDASPAVFDQVVVGGNTYLRLSVNRNPAVKNVLIEGLSTSAPDVLSSWSTSSTVIQTNTDSLFTVRDSIPMGAGDKRFIRLRFTQQ